MVTVAFMTRGGIPRRDRNLLQGLRQNRVGEAHPTPEKAREAAGKMETRRREESENGHRIERAQSGRR
jgi:hypothetical protein